jgi:hypothetical protein
MGEEHLVPTYGGKMPDKKFELKDSGQREQFDTGAVRDIRVGKGRYDLITPLALRRLAIIMEKGAEKYDSRNWEKGMPFSRLLDSAIRHINQYLLGWQDEDHLAQACFNLFAIMHFEEMRPDLDDLPHYMKEGKCSS